MFAQEMRLSVKGKGRVRTQCTGSWCSWRRKEKWGWGQVLGWGRGVVAGPLGSARVSAWLLGFGVNNHLSLNFSPVSQTQKPARLHTHMHTHNTYIPQHTHMPHTSHIHTTHTIHTHTTYTHHTHCTHTTDTTPHTTNTHTTHTTHIPHTHTNTHSDLSCRAVWAFSP